MKPKDDEISIKFLKLFSFSNRFDKLLILVGLVNAILAAFLHPIIFLLYGRVAKIFVDYQNSNQPSIQPSLLFNSSILVNVTTDVTKVNICLKSTSRMTSYDFDERMYSTLKWYVLVSFLGLLVNYLANVCFNTAAERQIKRIRNKFFETIVRQDMAFFDKNTPGELTSILISNLENVKTAISYKCSEFISLFGRGLACISFALITAPKFAVVFLGIVPLVVISINVMVRMIKKYTIHEFKEYASAGQIAQEILSSIRTVVSFGIQKKAIKDYGSNLKSAESLAVKKGFFKGLFEGISSCLFNSYFGIAVIYAAYLERNDCVNYNAGNLMAAFFCLVASTSSIGQAGPYLGDVAQSKGAAKKLFEILKIKSKIDVFKSNDKKIKNLTGNIQFEDICFSYPQRPENKILNGFSLKISAGKTVAFCGSSGCGKSTIFSLLQRFYLPNSGKIKIDDESIDELDLEWLRNQMALVSQEPILFTSSIKENIRLGRLEATDSEIEDAAKQANAHDFIMQTADKYETLVGERGTQLSGGQKQRIAIARALLRNPRILLLDEATSALDNQSEKIVQDTLDMARQGRTTLIIAHRLSTIRNADLIVGMENGNVKEMGTHEELIELKGIYHSLVVSQTKLNKTTKSSQAKKQVSVSEENSDTDEEDDATVEEETKEKLIRQISVKANLEEKGSVNKEEKQRKNLFRYEKKLWKIQKSELFWIILGVVSQMIVGMVFPLIALVFSQIYSIFSIQDYDERFSESLKLTSAILGLALVNFVFAFLLNYSLAFCGARLTTKIRIKMFESLLRQEIGFYDMDQNRSSVLSAQLASNAPLCKGLTSDKLGLLCQGFSGIGFAVIISFALNWKLASLMLIFVPVAFGAGVIVGRSSTNIKVKGKTIIEEGGRILTETVENIKTVSSLSREKYFLKEFEAVFDLKFSKTLALFHLQALFYSISNTLIFFVQITAFSFGYYLVKTDGLKVAHLYTIYAAMTFSSLILGRVYSQLPDQIKAKQAAKTAFKIIDRKSKIDSMSAFGLRPEKITGNIEFKNVCFEYSSRPGHKILNDFNLTVQNGQTNALVGASGCGKSTTIALLLRFYDITEGAILLDGVDIRKLNIQWLRSQIGLVSQEPVLFNYSIRENIANGDTNRETIPIEEIISATVQSNIQDRIESFPEKYETPVGNKGGQLSGGEKQRIAIARALIRKPKILLLDEATSALDNQSEQVVQEALEAAQKGRTCIVIAHRLSTIQDANKISVVKEGAVVEEGSHSTLMNNKNNYFNLQSQHKS